MERKLDFENHYLICFNNHVRYSGQTLYRSDHLLYKAPHLLRYIIFLSSWGVPHHTLYKTVSGFEHAH